MACHPCVAVPCVMRAMTSLKSSRTTIFLQLHITNLLMPKTDAINACVPFYRFPGLIKVTSMIPVAMRAIPTAW